MRFNLYIKFQSTHPTRGATRVGNDFVPYGQDFNPRTPHGVRLAFLRASPHAEAQISIHAPHTGCDYLGWPYSQKHRDFNPRTPHGVRPIPPLRAFRQSYFNPRTPHGVRQAYIKEDEDKI